ncbi:MAG: 2-hydroxychromene-2-carboxylate isomerase [Pseudomonadota bacterium]
MSTLEFLFDVGSPNAYFCHKIIPEIESRTGQTFTYVPILLGGIFKATNNDPPMIKFKEVKHKLAYMKREIERFIERHHLEDYRWNPDFPINTVKVMRGAIVADRAGTLRAYADAVFHHIWEDPKKMDDLDVIRSAFEESGFDAEAILTGIEDQAIKDALRKNTEQAVARGVFGSPTFFVGEEMFFGKETLPLVEEEITRRNAV